MCCIKFRDYGRLRTNESYWATFFCGTLHCVVRENIHTPSVEGFFGLNSPPFWKFQFKLILSFKNLAFKSPPCLEFQMTLCGGGMDIFWNHTHTHMVLTVESVDEILKCDQYKWKLLSSTFLLYCLLCCITWFKLLSLWMKCLQCTVSVTIHDNWMLLSCSS